MKPDRAKTTARRALVVGVSKYAPPISQLPAVANDVKQMAKLLSSRNGAFAKNAVNVLTDRKARKSEVLDGLRATLAAARANDTVFVYLAGHGTVVNGDYFFLPFDTDADDIEGSCVPLKTIKALFDKSKSRRVFLWLDFCHAGGILARAATETDRLTSIRRTLEVKQGHGKVIVAACTSSQSSFESSDLGHGLFTDALLRGLKGDAKSAQGEVTASSLYDFIDHQVVRPDQQPVFFGEMSGRIILMHYSDRKSKAKTNKATSKPARKKRSKPKAPWVMLGDNFYQADRVRDHADGMITIELTPESGEDESRIAALRPGQLGRTHQVAFAVNNDACDVQVEDIITEHAANRQLWTLTLKKHESQYNPIMEMGCNGISPDEIARQRAGRILINDPPPMKSRRGFDNDAILEHAISGSFFGGGREPVYCVVRDMYQLLEGGTAWKEKVRLRVVYLLKMTHTVEHIVELKFGAVRNQKVRVTFKGRRPSQYSNEEPVAVQVEGVCTLS